MEVTIYCLFCTITKKNCYDKFKCVYLKTCIFCSLRHLTTNLKCRIVDTILNRFNARHLFQKQNLIQRITEADVECLTRRYKWKLLCFRKGRKLPYIKDRLKFE